MLKISTSSSLTLSASHIVFRLTSTGALEPVYARQLVEGDKLVRLDKRTLEADEVIAIETVQEQDGYWAPLTREGTLLVNGHLASSYASFPHHHCHAFASSLAKIFSPRLVLDDEASQHKDGERRFVTMFKKMARFLGLQGRIHTRAETTETENKVVRKMPIVNDVKVVDDNVLSLDAHHTEF